MKTVQQARLSREYVWQLLGYLLADTSDRYRIRRVGLYFSRQGLLWDFEVHQFLARLAGQPVDVTEARTRFAHLFS